MTGKITRYFAYVAVDMIDYFEEKLAENEDKIYLVNRGCYGQTSEGTTYRPYIIEAEEGLIDSKYEWPFEEKKDI